MYAGFIPGLTLREEPLVRMEVPVLDHKTRCTTGLDKLLAPCFSDKPLD